MTEIDICEVGLDAPNGSLGALEDFYDDLGFTILSHDSATLNLRIGRSTLRFTETAQGIHPFYHFAFLVPGRRFGAAHSWLTERTEPLAGSDSDSTIFHFGFWDAEACYFHDPAGNIVELIAHHELETVPELSGRRFHADELVGISEIALVTADSRAAAATLQTQLKLPLWFGSIEDPGGLGFVGRKARTMILASPGRGWLPTGRPAEVHPVEVSLTGPVEGQVDIAGSPYRIRATT